jgi:starvation-inducible DNA-binding protein
MTELQIALKIALANTYLMGFKAQSYHWNVEGMFFPMFHDFFGDIYNELSTPIDDIAERIRTIYGYAPISIADLLTAATVMEDVARPVSAQMMLMSLEGCNQEVIDSLNKAFTLAEQEKNQGLMDVLASRLDAHAKHAWMIRSTLKSIGA